MFEIAAHEGDMNGALSTRRPQCPLRSIAFHSAMCGLNERSYDWAVEDIPYQLVAQDLVYHEMLVERYPVVGAVARNYEYDDADQFPLALCLPRGRGGFGGRAWHP